MKKLLIVIPLLAMIAMAGCAWEAVSKVPPYKDVFMTTGDMKDGDYEPLGMVSAMRIELAFSCLGILPPLYPMIGPQAQDLLYEQLAKEAKKMGANGVINIRSGVTPMAIIPGLIWIPIVNMSGMAIKM
ncbi:hypothetical protein JXM67_05290 [candidate division WOR-3 bacterium]|nr:hypothetical protein [candidate division WOR-3 bacterium]